MPEHIYLVGSEDVKNAGHSMHSAAERMSSAAGTIADMPYRLSNVLDEHVTRIESALVDHSDAQPTLRDRFAMAALPGVLASPLAPGEVGWCFDSADHVARIARFSYSLADAMLKARQTEEA